MLPLGPQSGKSAGNLFSAAAQPTFVCDTSGRLSLVPHVLLDCFLGLTDTPTQSTSNVKARFYERQVQ